MGKLITKGQAKMEVEYDVMNLTFTFIEREKRAKDAVKKVTDNCESFLNRLSELGIDITNVKADKNEVDESRFTDNDLIIAKRSITMKTEYDLQLLDVFMKIIAEEPYDVRFDADNELGDIKRYKEKLIKQASKMARDKAELIAEATQTRIIGIEKVKVEREADYIFNELEDEDEDRKARYLASPSFGERERSLTSYLGSAYSKLKKETTVLSSEVFIEWELEDKND